MAPPSSLVSKIKVQLKLSIARLRMVQQKDTAIAKQQRRAMAQLIEQGKTESARIRVENIIRSDITTELHEILELYCELLLARSQLLDPPSNGGLHLGSSSGAPSPAVNPDLEEAVRSIIHAAPRTEVKELHNVRGLLIEKFGKDFALSTMEGAGVADRVLSKLRTETPRPELVDAYLREICRTYGVHFPGDPGPDEGDGDNDDDDDEPSGGEKVQNLEAPLAAEELTQATPPKSFGPKSPVQIAPPSPSSDNVAPKVKLPGPPELKPGAKMKKAAERKPGGGGGNGPGANNNGGPGGSIPDVDELAARFAQLKR
ncbi:increased sodium tolerance protein-like protein 1 [Lineolata rhizophorae]|uniref:Increased sodium tolerance protein-like protein 1 n=1 Tax=Lineolata rhizophorae TaxID=578093 RepID=A0A6A6NU14_9PEZI|nr:increased sodium tolerance protein-like protein 1 [Lineolata rhizophorae]